jgi:hypothetical protein
LGKTIYELRTVKNGHVLKVVHKDGSEEELVHQEKFDDEIDSFHHFLYEIHDAYGPQHNSYAPKQIWIDIRGGRKYECEFTFAGVKVIADEEITLDNFGGYGDELLKEVQFFKRYKIPIGHISIRNGVVKGHELRASK